ncbi:MAG: ThiF family adenylyltransferase [Opitutales bacterium]|nr:ThiF family adenylyltransferase [Opitutales bacterium]
MGLRKTDVMKGRVLDVNPAANVEIFDGYIDEKSIPNLLLKKPGIVVDAIDSIAPKISLIKAALSSDIKLVSSMGAARRKDPSFIKTAPVFKTRGCPVASAVRKALRGGGAASADFMCVFSDEILSESSHVASGGEGSKKIIGSSAVITSIFGVRLAGLAVEELTKNDTR